MYTQAEGSGGDVIDGNRFQFQIIKFKNARVTDKTKKKKKKNGGQLSGKWLMIGKRADKNSQKKPHNYTKKQAKKLESHIYNNSTIKRRR